MKGTKNYVNLVKTNSAHKKIIENACITYTHAFIIFYK